MFDRTVDQAFRRFRRTGDPASLARVFDRTAPELWRLARHVASGEAAAEDLVQATFLTAIESAEDHDGRRPAGVSHIRGTRRAQPSPAPR